MLIAYPHERDVTCSLVQLDEQALVILIALTAPMCAAFVSVFDF